MRMWRNRKAWAATIALGIALGSTAASHPKVAPEQVTDGTILDGVTIVDTRTGKLNRNAAILIRNGKIARIARAGTMRAEGTAVLVRAEGKYVVPGYLDMHAHPLEPADPATSYPLMIANGVTGYRQMGGSPALLRERREGRLGGQPLAPELLATPGMVMAGPHLREPAAARAEVSRQHADGADFIKVVDLTPPSFFAALDQAKALGIPFVGHLPPSIDVREAASRGMGSIEHLGPTASILEACSRDEAAIRQIYKTLPPSSARISFNMPPAQLRRLTANPLMLIGADGFPIVQRVADTYNEAKCRDLARFLAGTGTWQVPTLIRLRAMEFGNDAVFRNDPNLKYVSADERALWVAVGGDFETKLTAGDRETLAKLFARQMKLTRLFDEAGVRMLAGSDFGGQWLVAGFSLHQEFDLLARAGLSPLRILQMATLNGAIFLKREADLGTVEVGKEADLVLLDGNPLNSVRNLHRIHAVVLNGQVLSRSRLDGILAEQVRS